MQPNNPSPTPPPNPVPPAPQTQQQPQSYVPNPGYPSVPPPKRKSPVIWVVIIGGILALLAVLSVVLLFVVAPYIMRAEAYSTASKFYEYSLDNNTSKLASLYDDDSAKDFVNNAASKVDKSCTVDKTSYKELSTSPLKVRVNGNCTDGVKDWTFELTRPEGGSSWMLTGIVYNSTGTTASASSSPKSTASPSDKSDSLACLVPSDAVHFTSVAIIDVYEFFYADSFFFTADSTSYQYADQAQTKIAKFADFYEKNSGKAFTYVLRGSVNEETQSDAGKALAQQRADLIKNELMKLGVPSNRIEIGEPRSVANQYIVAASRNVDITVRADTDCGASAPTAPTGR